jgi:hypothetical protein
MDRGTNENTGSKSKGGHQKLYLGPPYKTNMSSPGPGLRLERLKARGTSIRQPVVEKICVVRGPGRSNEENYFLPRVAYRELLLTSLPRVITNFFEVMAAGKGKRAIKILTSDQQQALQGLAGTSFITRGQGAMAQPNKVDFDVDFARR